MKKITDEEICKKLLEDAATMPMNLEELSDEKLDELFALEVCGLTHRQWLDADNRPIRDFNFLLPYLEKRGWSGASNRCGETSCATVRILVNIDNGPTKLPDWEEIVVQSSDHPNDLCRAAVIALILAARKEKSR
jgi:hypothetical protein